MKDSTVNDDNISVASTASVKSTQPVNKSVMQLLLSLPDDKFKNKAELIALHRESSILTSQIKFRKDIDMQYSKLKLKEVNNDINELQFQSKFANKRNDALLASIQNDQFKGFSIASNSNNSRMKLLEFKSKYEDYYKYQVVQIKKEFNYQLIAKQNELLAAKAVYENQVKQNENIMKMENDYYERINQMNMKIIEKVKELQEKNEKIAKEREKKALMYQEMQRKLNEKIYNTQLEYHPDVEIKEEKKEEEPQKEEKDLKQSTTSLNKSKKYKTVIEKTYVLNMNHKRGKLDDIRQSQLNSIIQKKKDMLKNSSITEKRYEEDEKKDIVDKNFGRGVTFGKGEEEIDTTIKKKNSNEDNKEKPITSSIVNVVESKISKTSKKEEDEFDISSPKEDSPVDNSIKKQSTIKEEEVKVPEIKKEESIIPMKNENEDKKEEKPKVIEDNKKSLLFSRKESNASITQSQAANNDKPIEQPSSPKEDDDNTLTPYEKLIKNKPPLDDKEVLPEYKLQLLKRLIVKIEKYSKTQKPGKQIYQLKHSKTKNNKELLKEKFYDLIVIIHKGDEKQIEDAFNFLDINMALQFIFEILYTNINHNINADNLSNKTPYNENDFDKDIDKDYRVIIKLIIEHFKTMITTKKVSLQIACNLLAKSILNFDHDEALTAKLLLVLEKKLAQRSKVPMGNKMFSHTFTSGFNVNFDKTNKSSNSMKGSSLQKSQSKSNVKGSNVFDEYE